jgi:hypothetical protein
MYNTFVNKGIFIAFFSGSYNTFVHKGIFIAFFSGSYNTFVHKGIFIAFFRGSYNTFVHKGIFIAFFSGSYNTFVHKVDNSFVEQVDDPAMYLSTTYKPTSFDKDEILANHRSFMTSLNIPSGKESEDLPYLYWIPKLHKTPYKERYIAGSSTCSVEL